ncbi:hypothetical protein L6R53_12475 [Myxococcota bacterium]|nr:hypothetical protein [Myxococcota bacterium]
MSDPGPPSSSGAGLDLPAERAGPYLRALAAGLHALAPHDAFVPLAEALHHLQALDPALSGDVLAPAAVDPRSGMPGWTWLERARAEAELARAPGAAEGEPGEEELARAAALDPALGARLQARTALHRFLRAGPLLPLTRLEAALRREGRTADVLLTYDRVAPDGRWLRLRIDLALPPTRLRDGTFHRRDGARLEAAAGLQHLLTRHATTPLLALQSSVEAALSGPVVRLSRGEIGPFWFPGLALPEGAPAAARGALVLHLALEQLSGEAHAAGHRDPWLPPPPHERPPPGMAIFRERRLAASPAAVDPLRAWSVAAGAETIVVPLRPVAVGTRSL